MGKKSKMKCINLVQLKGIISSDPRSFKVGDTQGASVRICTVERYLDSKQEEKERKAWHTVVAYGAVADLILKHGKKDEYMQVFGHLKTREYEKEGNKHKATDVILEDLHLWEGEGSVNAVILKGHLAADPRDFMAGQTQGASARMATTEYYTPQSGEEVEKTEWHNLVAYAKPAADLLEGFKKGAKLQVTGQLRHRDYEKEGVKYTVSEIVVLTVQKAGAPRDEQSQQQPRDEELPSLPSSGKPAGRTAPKPATASQKAGQDASHFPDDIPF